MQKYQCHKEVEAAKITGFRDHDQNGAMLEFGGGASHYVDAAWLEKHKPVIGGYFVRYPDSDGYTSFSPAKAFEAGYTAV